VASLGLVSPGVATDGITLIFLKKKLATLILVITVVSFIHFNRVSAPGGCHPAPFFTCPTSFIHHSL